MRTTIDLDDDVLHAVRIVARVEQKSLGRVLSELARRGLTPIEREIEDSDGFPVFHVPADAPPITSDLVRVALDES